MCAATAAYRGKSVILLDHGKKPGRKILMSGGGRCNFTNLNSSPANFLSDNPAFCISALKRYTPHDFLELIERHGIEWEEKAPGQLFCRQSSKDMLALLLTEQEWSGAELELNTRIESVKDLNEGFRVTTSAGTIECGSMVVATGGLSIPTMGASAFGYRLAEQFGLTVLPTRAGLVPFTLDPRDRVWLAPLSGISLPARVTVASIGFNEPILVTHRGISGPGVLQASNYWQPGMDVRLNILPAENAAERLLALKRTNPGTTVERFLTQHLPQRFASAFAAAHDWHEPLQSLSSVRLTETGQNINDWRLKPSGTEGYRTAEVTLGGVDTRQLSSKTMATQVRPDLFFIGEVVDVTGHLGGHNFQWAWASAVAAAQAI